MVGIPPMKSGGLIEFENITHDNPCSKRAHCSHVDCNPCWAYIRMCINRLSSQTNNNIYGNSQRYTDPSQQPDNARLQSGKKETFTTRLS